MGVGDEGVGMWMVCVLGMLLVWGGYRWMGGW